MWVIGLKRSICLTLLLLLTVGSAQAAIIETTGEMSLLTTPPESIRQNDLESDSEFFVFRENTISLPRPLWVNFTAPGTYTAWRQMRGRRLAADTTVTSYLVHADKIGDSRDRQPFSGSITFDRPVLGVIVTSRPLVRTHSIFAPEGTEYDPRLWKAGLEMRGNRNRFDLISLSEDRQTITFDPLHVNTWRDQIRIFTEPSVGTPDIPEPATLALLGLGGLAVAGKRRNRSTS